MDKRNWTTWLPEQYGYGRMKVWTSPLFKIDTIDVKENEVIQYFYKKVNNELES